MVKRTFSVVRSRWKLGLALACLLALALFLTSDLYPAAWVRCELGIGSCPAVEFEVVEPQTVFHRPECWVFYQHGDGQLEELTCEPGEPLRILPTSPEDAVEVYCTEAFRGFKFSNQEWDGLPEGDYLQICRWEEGEWQRCQRHPLGRLPGGPPDIRGCRVQWGCPTSWQLKDVPEHWGIKGFAVRLTVGGELDPTTEMHTTILSCSPVWREDNPRWEVVSIERISACDNRPGLKMIYVTVLDEAGKPLQGVKVRFDVESSYGVAYDHPQVWGLSDRFGRVDWDHFGVPTRYWLWMEDDSEPLIVNIRTDLGNEYCRPPGSPALGGWRPVNRPGRYSYRVRIQRRAE